jgi:CheY-like chemotaxis protein
VVEVDNELSELVLGVLDLARNLCALRDPACEDVRFGHFALCRCAALQNRYDLLPCDSVGQTGSPVEKPLAGRIILLVEDETLVALEVASALEGAGAKVTITGTLQHALLIAKHDGLSAAIIDHVLRDGDSAMLCKMLKERNVPFAMHSGFAAVDIPECRSVPHIPKPANPATIIFTLLALLEGAEL